jgi:predicted DNA-binding protein
MTTEEEIPRSIRFPRKLWEAIDQDAKRCRRSSVKQLEAILLSYYEIEDVDLHRETLFKVRDAGKPVKTKINTDSEEKE